MSVKSNTNTNSNDWITIKLRRQLYNEISQSLRKTKKHGVQKYDSVPDFVQNACIALLDREQQNIVSAEAVAN